MAITSAIDTTFKHLNADPSYSIKPGGVGREREAIVNVTIGASDNYVTGGITVDFSGNGLNFKQVYLCDVKQGQGGLMTEFVPAAGNDAATGKIKFYGSGVSSGQSAAATGTITLASAIATDTVTVNGLVYTAVAGAKANNTEFSIDTSDTAAATDLADSITNDTRVGTAVPSIDQTATSNVGVVTVTATQTGTGGNAITLAEDTGATTITVSGATLTGGASGDVGGFQELDNADPVINSKVLRCLVRGI